MDKIKSEIFIGIIIVLLILIFYTNYYNVSNLHEDFLFGSWESDLKFNKESDIKRLKVFIGEAKNNLMNVKRDCYFHMGNSNNENMISKIVKMSYRKPLTLNISTYSVDVNIDFEEDDPVPQDLKMEVDILNGIIKLYNDDKLYAVLYKDNVSTKILYDEKENMSSDDE